MLFNINIDKLENQIEFQEFIEFLDKQFYIEVKDLNCSLIEYYQTSTQKCVNLIIKHLRTPMFGTFSARYHEKFNRSFELILQKFLIHHYKDIDFDLLPTDRTTKEFLNRFLFDRNAFIDTKLFLMSLRYKQYLARELEVILNSNVLSTSELESFWLEIAQYQHLTCTFIQKYYMKFTSNSKLAYYLKIHKNQLYSCNDTVLRVILKKANEYQLEV
jgi:hypothetical protein